MEIEYIYPDPDDDKDLEKQIKQMQKENSLGCLIVSLFLLGGLFIFLTLLPIILVARRAVYLFDAPADNSGDSRLFNYRVGDLYRLQGLAGRAGAEAD